jgi:hypothetical protein
MLMLSNEEMVYVVKLESENEFLKQRNKELRQKTYINVYDENLKMIDEIKALKHENQVKYNDLLKYERTIEQLRKELIQIGQVADAFHKDAIKINEENKELKGVLQSVESFVQRYSR